LKIKFLGAARQVTGSCYLLEAGGLNILVDCGMYQERKFLDRNWDPFAVYPGSVDHVLLTHCHLDHSGLIPDTGRRCRIQKKKTRARGKKRASSRGASL